MGTSPESFSFVSRNESETHQLAVTIGHALQPGTLLTLQGTLGAGKTRLVQSIAESLGVERRRVVSPTFTLIQTYEARLQLVHIDAYRISDEDQYDELGIDEYLDSDAVVAMEWAEKFLPLLPGQRLAIEISVLGKNERRITLGWPAGEGICQSVGRQVRDQLAGP